MCEVCDGQLVVLGILGHLQWCRCQDCGTEQHVQVTDENESEEE